jgi:hypothetical protein
MSLLVSEWKKVLDQPKNLGLKAGTGTGVSKALEEVDKKKALYDGEKIAGAAKAAEAGAAFIKALEDLIKKCEEVIGKHRKLFTTACDYLKNSVIASANQRIKATRDEIAALQNEQKDAKTIKESLKHICTTAEQAFPQATDIHELMTLWAKFNSDIRAKSADYQHICGPQNFNNDMKMLEQNRFGEANAPALETWRQRCARAAELIGSRFSH